MLTYNQMVVDDIDDEATSQVFHALADTTRRDILRRAVSGDLSVSRLAEHYPMSFAAVQKHVAVLERAGLVSKQRNGREHLVKTNPRAVRAIRDTIDRLENAWFGRIERMARLLDEDTKGQPT